MDNQEVTHMKCRRGSDRITSGQSCDGLQVEKINTGNPKNPMFKCKKCGFSWSVPIGGEFNFF